MSNFDWKKLYYMKLGDFLIPTNNSHILRVPGGWVYSNMQGNCFIPYNNDIKEKTK
jgi:hypothetical protein